MIGDVLMFTKWDLWVFGAITFFLGYISCWANRRNKKQILSSVSEK